MSASRAEILGRIQRALGNRSTARAADYQAITRQYRQSGTLDPEARLNLFVVQLQDYGVEVHRCVEQALPRAIAHALAVRGKRCLIVPKDLPWEWLPKECKFVPDSDSSHAELDRSEGVLTGCTVCIALTGTIVLCHWVAEGRRALTLVPDYHLCVVRADQIVETVAEGIRRIRTFRPRLITTISGPSATADIEMTRVKGVHGPRTLDVILVAN